MSEPLRVYPTSCAASESFALSHERLASSVDRFVAGGGGSGHPILAVSLESLVASVATWCVL